MTTRTNPARPRPAVRPTPPPKKQHSYWLPAGLGLLLLYLTFEVYGPALRGPFLYDDLMLPFLRPEFADLPLSAWISSVRPLLMFTYWVNYQWSGSSTLGYHVFNLLFHLGCSGLIYLILRKLLAFREPERFWSAALAAFGAAVFLFHPVQTEAVSYVASRSDTLSVLFFLGAFAVFLYRRADVISWPEAITVLVLFGCAAATKEHTAVLPVLLLLTDRFWFADSFRQSVQRNWRLYVLLVGAGTVAAVSVWSVLAHSTSAGFSMSGMRWYEYFFTQFRVIPLYLRLFVLPVGQNFDYDLPLSHTLLEHGSWAGFAALAAGVAAAWRYRKEYPLASYGFLVFLLLIAPTSSVIPIKDVVAERRLYLPMIGLLLITSEFLLRFRAKQSTRVLSLAAIVAALAVGTYLRNEMWGSGVRLWEDTVAKSPKKLKLYEHLAHAYVVARRCPDAVKLFENLERTTPVPPELLVHWSLAYECVRNYPQALAKLQQAAAAAPDPATYYNMARIQRGLGRPDLAQWAIDQGLSLNASWDALHSLRGDVLMDRGERRTAAESYQRALQLNPRNEHARQQLAMAGSPSGNVRRQ